MLTFTTQRGIFWYYREQCCTHTPFRGIELGQKVRLRCSSSFNSACFIISGFAPKRNKMQKWKENNFGEGKFVEDGSFLHCLFLNSVEVIEKGLRRCSTYPFSFVWSAVTLSNKWLCNYLVKKLCILCILWSCVAASSLSSESLHRTVSQVLMNCVESVIRLSFLHWLLFYHLLPHCISHKFCFLKHAGEFSKGLFSLPPSCAV